MPTTFTCPHCRMTYKTSGKSLGKRVKCKRCGKAFTAVAADAPTIVKPDHDTGEHP